MSNTLQNYTNYLNLQHHLFLQEYIKNPLISSPLYLQTLSGQFFPTPQVNLINQYNLSQIQLQQAVYLNMIKNYQNPPTMMTESTNSFQDLLQNNINYNNSLIQKNISNCKNSNFNSLFYQEINPITDEKITENSCTKHLKRKKRRFNSDADDNDSESGDRKSTELSFADNNISYKNTVKINKRTKAVISEKYDEKVCLLGTKEEYEKFFKHEASPFTESELNLINFIDKPRKGKKKKQENMLNCFGKNISNKIKQEINEFAPYYEEQLEELKKDKHYSFMINNFPEMYSLNNFYIHIKQNFTRKEKIHDYTVSINVKEETEIKLKKSWDCNKIDDQKCQEFLFSVEKVWPIKNYKFSQELVLELLKSNDYDFEKTKMKIIEEQEDFKNMIKEKYTFLHINHDNLR